jgi:hypothetical protein
LAKNGIFRGAPKGKLLSFEQKSWIRELKDISISNILKSVQNLALSLMAHLEKCRFSTKRFAVYL